VKTSNGKSNKPVKTSNGKVNFSNGKVNFSYGKPNKRVKTSSVKRSMMNVRSSVIMNLL
jgi:hypothetical protein